MSDRFMHALHEAPSSDLSARIRARLAAQDEEAAASKTGSWRRRTAVVAAAAAVVAMLASWPAARAATQGFLDLFRVTSFTAVPLDVSRLNRLGDAGLDLRDVIGNQVRVVKNPGPPQTFTTPEDASAAAGLAIKAPANPAGLIRTGVEVEGERTIRLTADVQRLRSVLAALGITDVDVPDALDGMTATVRVPPIARVEYANGGRTLTFLQARSPEVSAPAGLDLPRLGEIALRIAGMDAAQAHTLAGAIDWRNTLVVPVPSGSGTFRQVDVHGARGLLVETTGDNPNRALAWSDAGVVYGLTGNLNPQALMLAAESVQ
jgi:hypothetical protein